MKADEIRAMDITPGGKTNELLQEIAALLAEINETLQKKRNTSPVEGLW